MLYPKLRHRPVTEADLEAQMDAYWNKVPEIAAKKLNKELEDDMVCLSMPF